MTTAAGHDLEVPAEQADEVLQELEPHQTQLKDDVLALIAKLKHVLQSPFDSLPQSNTTNKYHTCKRLDNC